ASRRTPCGPRTHAVQPARHKPAPGTRAAHQPLNDIPAGTLIQHTPDEVNGALAHEQPNPRTEPGHSVTVVKGTLLHRICATDELKVNSAHHQAAKDLGTGVVVDARADDGVIEGIEHPKYRFCLGVQWHPEYSISTGDTRIFDAFIAAARA